MIEEQDDQPAGFLTSRLRCISEVPIETSTAITPPIPSNSSIPKSQNALRSTAPGSHSNEKSKRSKPQLRPSESDDLLDVQSRVQQIGKDRQKNAELQASMTIGGKASLAIEPVPSSLAGVSTNPSIPSFRQNSSNDALMHNLEIQPNTTTRKLQEQAPRGKDRYPFQARAISEFKATNNGELNLIKGGILIVLREVEAGWANGERNKFDGSTDRGRVPRDSVEAYDASHQKQLSPILPQRAPETVKTRGQSAFVASNDY